MPGLKRPSPAVSAVLYLLCGVTAQAQQTPDEAMEHKEQELSEAFLEFLGEWEDPQGNWQDPMDFDGLDWQVLDGSERRHDRN